MAKECELLEISAVSGAGGADARDGGRERRSEIDESGAARTKAPPEGNAMGSHNLSSVEDEVEVGESTRCSSSCELELACMRTYGVRCRMTKASCID